ncbi:putative lipopolysaccharide biosynthesis protein [Calothrix sp. NIES-4071]|nr:putative lipopolysaccharide biosynthesis protein [Calothrix sp. NIES-4071]BAZ56055.1 putative lipopolysaccharide biosynthesis protein [Calothrix sp. NIES-4105]
MITKIITRVSTKVKEVGLRATISKIFYKIALFLVTKEKDVKVQVEEAIYGKVSEFDEIILGSIKYTNDINKYNAGASKISSIPKVLEFAWLVPFFSRGSGGHQNLFRFVKFLESVNCKCTVYIVGDYEKLLTPEQIRQQIREYFATIKAEVKIYSPNITYPKTNIVVCTSWITAYAGLTMPADLKVYFVQDYEPLFYSSGSYSFLAQNTYKFGYYHITLGKWLSYFLRTNYEVNTDYYDIVVDKNIYYPRTKIKSKLVRSLVSENENAFKVAFYGRNVTPRRCFELVVMALYLFAEQAENIVLICYGWNDIPPLPFKSYNAGMLSVEDLAELYSVCDVCIAPSSTNLSLVAREVMACGSVLMDLEVENTAYDLIHLENSYLVKPDPKSMCDGLLDLYHNRDLVKLLKRKSLQHIAQLSDWSVQGKRFHNLIMNKLNNSLQASREEKESSSLHNRL